MMDRGELLDLVMRHHRASARRLHLVPSENRMDLAARLPLITDLAARYSFPIPDGENWAWPGNPAAAILEDQACEGLRELYGARFVNVKPVSGLNAMTVALSALTQRGGTVASIAEADGGHGSTRHIAERFGLSWVGLPFDHAAYAVDIDRFAALAARLAGPLVVYLDQFMCLFPHDLPAIRAGVGETARICYDGSHVMGLIAGGQFQDPLGEGADLLCGSMHKSFPGPHKGILATNWPELAQLVDEHAGHWVSHHHPAEVAALAITVADIRADATDYAARVVANARILAEALAGGGLAVCAGERGWTASHQVWVDIAPVMSAEKASALLLEAGIVVNAIDVPYLPAPGLRLGVAEATRLGMDGDDMRRLAEVMAGLLTGRVLPATAAAEVTELLNTRSDPDEHGLEQVLETVCAAIGLETPTR